LKALLPSIFKFYDRFTTEENTDKTKPLTIQKGERLFLISTNKPPAMLVEPKCFSFKLKEKTSCSKMEVVWRPHPKYRRNER